MLDWPSVGEFLALVTDRPARKGDATQRSMSGGEPRVRRLSATYVRLSLASMLWAEVEIVPRVLQGARDGRHLEGGGVYLACAGTWCRIASANTGRQQ
jgi:hypothetical protein